MKIHVFQHVAFEMPGMILDWAKEHRYTITYTYFFEKDPPWPAVMDYDFLVILGGPMGVSDVEKFEWLAAEKQMIRQAIAANKIILGICLGAQLLAEALGARVYSNPVKEIGFYPVEKTEVGKKEPLIEGIPSTWDVFHWHGDTFDLPEDALHLFHSKACRQQAFIKGSFLGIQFHPEADASLIEAMVVHESAELIKDDYVQTAEEIMNTMVTQPGRAYFYELLTKLVLPASPS